MVSPFCVVDSQVTRPVDALNVDVQLSPAPKRPARPRPKPPPSPTNAPWIPPPISELRDRPPSLPPPNQSPAARTPDAGVPTKLLVRSPYPTGTVEKAPVSALAANEDRPGFVSSPQAAAATSGVMIGMR